MKTDNKAIYVTQPIIPNMQLLNRRINTIFSSKRLTNFGSQHQEFELRLKSYLQTENLALFVNGTLALELALRALNLKGEVITTPFTFPATVHSLIAVGLKPVFADIENKSLTIDPRKIEEAITPATSAILAVHVYGNPCYVDEIQRIASNYKLKIIYDAAHAFGMKYNNRPISEYGDVTMFSLHATKIMHSIEGGVIVHKDKQLASELYLLKNFGIANEDEVVQWGTNAKLNEISSAVGIVVLQQITDEIAKRKRITELYHTYLDTIPGISIVNNYAQNTEYTYQYLVIRVNKSEFGVSRDDLFQILKDNSIYARKYFYPLLSHTPIYAVLPSSKHQNLPVAENAVEEVLCLPLYGDLTEDQLERIISTIKSASHVQ